MNRKERNREKERDRKKYNEEGEKPYYTGERKEIEKEIEREFER